MHRHVVFSLCLLQIASSFSNQNYAKRSNKVLVISLDGFRWDYLDTYKSQLGNISRVARHVRAAYSIPVFPTMTFPNHYSIVTGVYPETHGIVHNTFLVPEVHRQFVKSKTDEIFWNMFEPIWVTATLQNISTGTHLWPGSMADIQGYKPTYRIPIYDTKIPWNSRADQVVKWLVDDDVNLAMLYYHQPDKISHLYGPGSRQVLEHLIEADNNIGYVIKKLSERNALEEVDILIVSDHGMTKVDVNKVIIIAEILQGLFVDDYFDKKLRIESWARGSVLHLWPKENKILELYKLLKNKTEHFDFYLKDEIPEKWHYRNSSRIPPILGVGKLGWRAVWYQDDLNIPKIYGSLGSHGYDNSYVEMRSVFYAMGPSFKTGVTLAPFETLHLYALISELAGIRPRRTNATLKPFLPAFRFKPRDLPYFDDFYSAITSYQLSGAPTSCAISRNLFSVQLILAAILYKLVH